HVALPIFGQELIDQGELLRRVCGGVDLRQRLIFGVPAPIETRLPICAPSRGASAKVMTTVTKIIRERRMVCLLLRNAGADRGRGYQDRGKEETSWLSLPRVADS